VPISLHLSWELLQGGEKLFLKYTFFLRVNDSFCDVQNVGTVAHVDVPTFTFWTPLDANKGRLPSKISKEGGAVTAVPSRKRVAS
jgi:hypothetical protein